jgi:hypothetical protein
VIALALWLLAAAVLVVFAVLATPVRLEVLAEAQGRVRLRVRAAPLDGRGPTVPLIDSWRPRRRKRATRGSKRPSRRRGGRTAPPAGAILRLLRDTLARIRIRRLRVSGVFGLADPSATGQVYGALCALKHGFPGGAAVLDVGPDFTGPRLEGRAEGVVSVIPLALAAPAIRFALHVKRAPA